MAKSRDAFRTISEVAEWLDIQAHVLRFWESKFSQVKPVKRAGGRRYYRPQDMLLLGGIKKLLHDDGLTIKGAQKLLREQGIKHVSSLSHSLDEAHGADVEATATSDEQEPQVKIDTPLFDATESTSGSDVVEETVADDEPSEAEAEDRVTAPTPDVTVASAPVASEPAENTVSDPDEALEDFLVLMRTATHIHPTQATEAADLVARFQALFAAPQETEQA